MANKQTSELVRVRAELKECQESRLKSDFEHERAIREAKSNYEHRHNACLAKAQEVSELKHALSNEKFQHAALRNEVTRQLLLQAFPGGVQDELMVTRSRNRILEVLTPHPEQMSEERCSDTAAESPASPSTLETTRK